MIKFFRKIRQRLLAENKVSKYLLYAIGEIVLVVIGILIALSINNWNGDRKERRLEVDILNEIANNLENDLVAIDYGIEITTLYRDNIFSIYNHLEQKTPLTDSLRMAYSRFYGGRRFNGATMGFENLRNTGINIIQNDSLKASIVELYNVHLIRLTNVQAVGAEVSKLVIKQMVSKLKTGNKYVEPLDIITLYDDHEFKETTLYWLQIKDFQLRRYENVKVEVKKTLNNIYAELEKTD